jgi:predicted nucleic acid-binding protein
VILADTDILIAHLRGVTHGYEWLKQVRQSGPLVVSALTIAELTDGMRSSERREV